jgi:hypothetical protein
MPAHDFRTTLRHRKLAYLLRLKRRRAPGNRSTPETIVLDVRPGVVPSAKPTVRIFVGTEPAQFRAERVLVWSIQKHRDPARRYEIHLMKDLVGFNRDKWKTGFTYYRYGIPALAGGAGRAIYTDVDQIYLADPAALFDVDMHGKGQLGIDEWESSVMLLDCERMSRVWHYADAQRRGKHRKFRGAVHDAGLWGPLPRAWNARDGEYVAGESKLLHFTTLQTQPWQPFPDELRYHPHPVGALARVGAKADAAGFTIFTKERPSRRFAGSSPSTGSSTSKAPALKARRRRTPSAASRFGITWRPSPHSCARVVREPSSTTARAKDRCTRRSPASRRTRVTRRSTRGAAPR